ncbi:23622_t:CDS:2, partial [Gigaspora rosea]
LNKIEELLIPKKAISPNHPYLLFKIFQLYKVVSSDLSDEINGNGCELGRDLKKSLVGVLNNNGLISLSLLNLHLLSTDIMKKGTLTKKEKN